MDTQQAPLTRAAAIAWAREIVGDPDAVYLDTETTGLGSSARICDIAIVAQDGTVLFDSLINPGEPIPAVATKVHGINDDMVADAPTWEDVAPDIGDLISMRSR
ncbi:MAG: 3'-5' exonuclease, partial [Thermomicrobiales bacterium]|nr:3'-5' exonuclease [Thermomicrobiales bacterium]